MSPLTDRTRFQREAERNFPHRVDIPVPPGGLGRRLTDMHQWCRENVTAGEWAQHGHQVRRKGECPADFARFYFSTTGNAEAFRWRWGGDDA